MIITNDRPDTYYIFLNFESDKYILFKIILTNGQPSTIFLNFLLRPSFKQNNHHNSFHKNNLVIQSVDNTNNFFQIHYLLILHKLQH